MSKIVCFGEIMGRLCPVNHMKIVQARNLELTYAGGEANVAVSLANYNEEVAYVTKIPDNDLGKAVMRDLRAYKVNVDHILVGGERLGMYYVEKGASQRPSKVIYDRKYSSISMAEAHEFDWNSIFEEADWFHFTGITPALSEELALICEQACMKAKELGISVSCDLNYRNSLWSQEKANEVMSKLMAYVDVCIANEEDAEKVFGIKADKTDVMSAYINEEGYVSVAKEISDRFACHSVAITLRESISASDNGWSAMIYKDKESYFSKKYSIHLVDRVGGGDSFAGGLIYGLLNDHPMDRALEFAVAASCLKQTIHGDYNQVTVDEVENLMSGDGSGRVQR